MRMTRPEATKNEMKRFLTIPLILAGGLVVSGCAGPTETKRAIVGLGAGMICDDVGVCHHKDAYKNQPSSTYTYPVNLNGRTVYVRLSHWISHATPLPSLDGRTVYVGR